MTATHPTFALMAGDSWRFDASLHDNSGKPLDLTSASILWRLYQGGKTIIELTNGNGITVTDAPNGLCTIMVTAAQTAALTPGTYSDQVQATLASGFACTQAVGPVLVSKPGTPPTTAGADPCTTLALLRAAKLSLLGVGGSGVVQRVRIEGFEVQYGVGNMADLDRTIAYYDDLCRKATGGTPRRFAIGSGARSRTY